MKSVWKQLAEQSFDGVICIDPRKESVDEVVKDCSIECKECIVVAGIKFIDSLLMCGVPYGIGVFAVINCMDKNLEKYETAMQEVRIKYLVADSRPEGILFDGRFGVSTKNGTFVNYSSSFISQMVDIKRRIQES